MKNFQELTEEAVHKLKQPRIKIVIHDGIVEGCLFNKAAVDAGIAVEIVDADSEVDSNASVRMELEEAGMEDKVNNIVIRHPEQVTQK